MLLGWTLSLTPEEASVDDLAKAHVKIKFILFIEKTDLVSYIYWTNRMRNTHTVINFHALYQTYQSVKLLHLYCFCPCILSLYHAKISPLWEATARLLLTAVFP